jgi:hypothetical protein
MSLEIQNIFLESGKMVRDYQYTPAMLLDRAKDWYKLARSSEEEYNPALLCSVLFSLELLLKALICLDKSKATTKFLKSQGHDLGKLKQMLYENIAQPDNLCLQRTIESFFKIYPALEKWDPIDERYGLLGAFCLEPRLLHKSEEYEQLFLKAGEYIHENWDYTEWKNV